MEPTTALHRALDQTSAIVAGIDDGQLGLPTPCADFDVRALLNHTVASLDGLADAATGSTWDLTAYGRDVLGDDPKGTFLRAAERLREATPSDGDTLERTWNMPFGETPGSRSIAIAILGVTQHGWDVAKATGQQPDYDEELAEAALELAHQNMPPADQRTPESFGPPVPVADDAPAHDRLAAFLGWTP
jgi:uncharacterized protein (TIGR03086 family)